MRNKHRCLLSLLFIIILSISATVHAADEIDLQNPSIPSSAKEYGASTCHYGFSTTRYLSKPAGGFGNSVCISSDYITWDGETDYDFFLFARPKDQNKHFLKPNWGTLYCGFNNIVNYSRFDIDLEEDTNKIFFRIENPSYTTRDSEDRIINFLTGEPIENMTCHGYFWLG